MSQGLTSILVVKVSGPTYLDTDSAFYMKRGPLSDFSTCSKSLLPIAISPEQDYPDVSPKSILLSVQSVQYS